MKQVIWGVVSVITTILMIFIVMTINGKMTRKKDVTSSLSSVVNQAIDDVLTKNTYSIQDKNTFVADVLQELLATYSNDSDIKIEIANADEEKGLLGIKVTETYKNPNGTIKDFSYEKVVILETEEYNQSYELTYLTSSGTLFSKIVVNGGEKGQVPLLMPNGSTKWYIEELNKEVTNEEIQNMEITRNYTFKAK